MARFAGKSLVVTGAGRGIGLAIARRLAAEGGQVLAIDLDPPREAEGVLPVRADVSDPASVHEAIAQGVGRFGRFDGVVNCAAILDATGIADLDLARHRQVLAVNLEGALLVTQATLPHLAARAAVVNVASIMGLFGLRQAIPYSNAKAALINMTRNLAVELAPTGVRVNAIAPGFVETRMSRLPDGSSEYDTDEFREVYLKHRKLPLGRPGQPEEMAGPTLFLLSDDASYVTGHVLVVDGGVTATY